MRILRYVFKMRFLLKCILRGLYIVLKEGYAFKTIEVVSKIVSIVFSLLVILTIASPIVMLLFPNSSLDYTNALLDCWQLIIVMILTTADVFLTTLGHIITMLI